MNKIIVFVDNNRHTDAVIKVFPFSDENLEKVKELCRKNYPNGNELNYEGDYKFVHFMEYTRLIVSEMEQRNYKVSQKAMNNFLSNFEKFADPNETLIGGSLERILFCGLAQ